MLTQINRARVARQLSYAALADKAEVDPSQVSRICRGKFTTFSDAVVRICTALGVPAPAAGAIAGPIKPVSSVSPMDVSWDKLERSLRRAWDKTPTGADRLVEVITAVAKVGRR